MIAGNEDELEKTQLFWGKRGDR